MIEYLLQFSILRHFSLFKKTIFWGNITLGIINLNCIGSKTSKSVYVVIVEVIYIDLDVKIINITNKQNSDFLYTYVSVYLFLSIFIALYTRIIVHEI